MWGFGFYLVLLGESNRVSLSLVWRKHAPSFPIWNVAFCFSGGVFLDDGNFTFWWQTYAKIVATMESHTSFVHQVDLGTWQSSKNVGHGSKIECHPTQPYQGLQSDLLSSG